MHTVYIHPESALHFDGVYLLTLSLGALLYLSFAVFSSGFQQTTEGAGSRTGNVYESFQKKKKKKPRQSLRHVQLHRVNLAVVSSAATKSSSLLLRCLHVGKADKLNRVNLSTGKPAGSVSGPVRKPELKHSFPLHSVLETLRVFVRSLPSNSTAGG